MGLYALEHGVHGFDLDHFSPTWAVFIAVAPVLFYNLVGFELPSAAAGEMRNPQRDVPASIARAGALTLVLYSVPIVAILAVVPAERITSLTGFIDAMKSVFTVYGGHVSPDGTVVLSGAGQVLGSLAAAGFIWVLLANGLTWVLAPAAARRWPASTAPGPAAGGRFSGRLGTPVLMCLSRGGRDGDDGRRLPSLPEAAASATSASCFRSRSSSSPSRTWPYSRLSSSFATHMQTSCGPSGCPVEAAGAWLCSTLATAWAAFAILAVLWPGLGTPNPDAALPDGFAGDRLGFVLAELVPLVAATRRGACLCSLRSPLEASP